MGFESFIADAAGKLHDVSKGAFDTFGMKHQGKFKPGFGKLMEGSFLDGAKSILKDAGVSADQLESWGGSEFWEKVSQFTGSAGKEVAAGAAGAVVGGPLGAALGGAMEAGGVLHKLWTGTKRNAVFYQEGQWIAIDNGMTLAAKGLHNVLETAWDKAYSDHNRRRLLVQSPDADQMKEEGFAQQNALSIGFVLGPGPDPDTVTVFNCLKLRDETKDLGDVRPLDAAHMAAMDSNSVWSEIRLLRFEEEVAQQLNTDVVTDPGVEVKKDGVTFFVVRSHGNDVLIEHPTTGAQNWTTVDQLTPGRRVHNNTWNYQEGGVGGSFASGQKATITQGDWIWVPAEGYVTSLYGAVKRQLACIEMLDGSDVVAYYAVDGERFKIAQNSAGLRPVSDELNEFINNTRELATFKDSVVRGWNTRVTAPGNFDKYTLLTLGITPLDATTEPDPAEGDWRTNLHKLYHQRKEEQRKANISIEKVGTAGDQGLKEDLDDADEAAELGGELRTKVAQEVLEETPYEDGDPPKSGNSSLVMFGLAAGAGLLFLLR